MKKEAEKSTDVPSCLNKIDFSKPIMHVIKDTYPEYLLEPKLLLEITTLISKEKIANELSLKRYRDI